jgi:LCP family protein required for cell wall assembly
LVLHALAAGGMACLAVTLWLGWQSKRALDNFDQMIVPTITLPTMDAASHLHVQELATAPASIVATAPAALRARSAEAATPTPLPTLDGPLNILLLGTDTRPGVAASRTDAMVVVHIDPRTNQVGLLSLPRDLWAPIPGHGEARVNSAYAIGELQVGKGYGPALAKQTIGDLLGLPIQHFVLVDLQGFRTLIDKLGGIELDVPQAIDDPTYPTDDFGTVALHFEAGRQRMDGAAALAYARTRHPDSDFGRNQRQQQVLMAIFDQIRAQGLPSQLTSLDDYTDALRDYVRTDLSRAELLRLAVTGARLHGDDIRRYAIEPRMVVQLRPPATFAADSEALRQLVGLMLGDAAQSDERATPVANR